MKKSVFRNAALVVLSAIGLASCGGDAGSYDNYDLLAVRISGSEKWSMVNSDGEIVYKNKFEEAPTAAYNGLFSVKENDGITVYSISDKETPQPVEGLKNLKCAGALNEDLMPVTFNNSRIAVVDKTGKKKFTLNPVDGSEVISCYMKFTEGMLAFKTEIGKFGFFNSKGEVAIEPKYSAVAPFSEGLSVVKGALASADVFSVIDKTGEVVFCLPDDFEVVCQGFKDGLIVAKYRGDMYLITTDGTQTKLPENIKGISDYNSKYIIFKNKDKYGVANIEGEELISPEYESIFFDSDDTVIAFRDIYGDESVKLSVSGKELKKTDYTIFEEDGKFGYIAAKGKDFFFVDNKFKVKGDSKFEDVSNNISYESQIVTDYINYQKATQQIVDVLKDGKIVNHKILDSAEDILGKCGVEDDKVGIKELVGPGFTGNVICYFDEQIGYPRSGAYRDLNGIVDLDVNPNAKMFMAVILLETNAEWGKKGAEALKKTFLKSGFQIIKENADGLNCLYKRGAMYVLAKSGKKDCYLKISDQSFLQDIEDVLLEGLE